MGPTSLAVLTAAVTVAGTKFLEGTASEAGKAAWRELSSILGFGEKISLGDLSKTTAEVLQEKPELAHQVLTVLQQESGAVGMLVGSITADKVIVAGTIGTINM